MGGFTWRDDLSDTEWDDALSRLGGHPLQSAHWGRALHVAAGRCYVALAAFDDTQPVWMVRAEIRKLSLLGKVAWIPRGPTLTGAMGGPMNAAGMQRLAAMGFILGISSPWLRVHAASDQRAGPRTIWIDLTKGRDQLWSSLQKKWRHGVGYAARAGVHTARTRDPAHVREFFELCRSISQAKGFSLPASELLMRGLLDGDSEGPVSSQLFIANHEGRMGAGAFIVKCGQSIHYFWGATDRALAEFRVGEAVQWAVIEWALEQGCTLYDLEGIDPEGNPGVYQFKKKMGGEEVALPDLVAVPFSPPGRMIAAIIRRHFG